MASVFVKKTGNASTAALVSAAQDTTGCNFLAVHASCPVARTLTLTDSQGNTWTAHPDSPKTINGVVRTYAWYCANPTTNAAHTFTVTPSATDMVHSVVKGLSGRATTSPVENTNYAADAINVTTHVGGVTGVIAQSGDDVLVLISDDESQVGGRNLTWTPGSGLTLAAADYNGDGRNFPTGGIAYADNVSTASVLGNWTSSSSNIGGSYVMAVKASANTAYTLTAAQGSYALTGQTVTLSGGKILSAAFGTYSLIGSEAYIDLSMVAAQGSYALTGQAALFLRTLTLTAAQGSYSLNGQTASLTAFIQTAIPNQFYFTDEINVPLDTITVSDPVIITGNTAPANVTVVNGEWSKNGGAFTAASGTINSGDSVRVRHISSSLYLTATHTTLIVEGVSDTFTSTTRSQSGDYTRGQFWAAPDFLL